MCGICGAFAFASAADVDPDVVAAMNARLLHRGPDDGGQWTGPRVSIAMRRLSIVDVSGGHQPISNDAGDCTIVFNGEIYNHRALRQQLEATGVRFRTHSDTEVILRLYEAEGEAAIARLDGMFALAIVDLRRDRTRPRLVLARDRLGKKPLYYATPGGTLVFGSELKAVLAHPGVSRELDAQALHHYLSLLVVPEPWSIYRSVRKLPAGTLMVVDEGGPRIRRYWSLDAAIGEAEPPSRDDALRTVKQLLFRAVEKRLDLEVPFGAFLSGGLDSGAVVGVMTELLQRPVKTFSIGFEGPASHNELPAARLTAQHFGTDHHELMATPDIVELTHELVRVTDEPLAISSCIPLLLLSREAGRHVKVVMSGDGGDEVFGGYSTYSFERWATIWRTLPRVADVAMRALGPPRGKRFVANARHGAGARRLGWASGFSEAEKAELYADGFRDGAARATPSWLDGLLGEHHARSPEAQANVLDVRVWLADEMLAKVDRMTMAASLEARSPLLDDDLTAYLLGLDMGAKVPRRPGALVKPLLRDALGPLLPPHLREGRKWGFNVPLDDWFRGPAWEFLRSVLSPERVRRQGVFDPAVVERWVQAHGRGEVRASNRLFALLVFQIWAEERA